ncbi:hypothetical protein BU16DRAFT_554148 [Lophium mytilinum]|uniref:RING-type domain-containing protein n=1 Tax=Lophium mytilinum TaxID=390894 RepID=A0A6A6RCH2_9PEZI|nr:hypothetical protein BU16DRAFT_554148 [Lophium mytilinum]
MVMELTCSTFWDCVPPMVKWKCNCSVLHLLKTLHSPKDKVNYGQDPVTNHTPYRSGLWSPPSSQASTTMPIEEFCPVCKDPFATSWAQRKHFVDEMSRNGFDYMVELDFDIAFNLPCGHAIGLLCMERWLHTGNTICPYCTADVRTPIWGAHKDKWPLFLRVVPCSLDPEYDGDPTLHEDMSRVVEGLSAARIQRTRECDEAALAAYRRALAYEISIITLLIGIVLLVAAFIYEIIRLEFMTPYQVVITFALIGLSNFIPMIYWQI